MSEDICVIESGGSSIVTYKPLFSHDSKYILCPCGNLIKVFSIVTGECYQRLIGHKDVVTGLCHHPKIKLQILSCSIDSTVKAWDYEDGTMLFTCDFSHPLLGIFAHSSYPDVAFVAREANENKEVCRFKLVTTDGHDDKPACDVIANTLCYDNYDKNIAFSPKYMLISYREYFLVYKDPANAKIKNKIRHALPGKAGAIMCLACHPVDDSCVTGHIDGEMRVWHNIANSANVVFHVQHWHSLEVKALSYSPSGSIILSGGHEAVLVLWKDDKKDFMPRLGAPIENICASDDGVLYATSMSDNSIQIITNYSTIKQTFEGFTATSQSLSCGLHYDPVTGACATNGKPGHLLFYFPQTDTQLYNLDIISRNYISSADLGKLLTRTIITKVTFVRTSLKEYFMATLEFDCKSKRDQKLKFWTYDKTEQGWRLETIVTSPHANYDVSSLNFNPLEAICISTSVDGKVKMWEHTENEWTCEGSTSYRGYPCNDSAFSQDGSLLALAFKHAVLLCEHISIEDMTLLVSHSTDVMFVEFGRDTCCHLLVVASSDEIQCWNIITGAIMWCTAVEQINFLIRDNFSENMAVFTNTKKVHIFRPSDKLPLYSHDLTCDVISGCFIPGGSDDIEWQKNSDLYFISKQMTVHKFSTKSETEKIFSKSRVTMKDSVATPISTLLSAKIEQVQGDFVKESLRESTMQGAMKYIIDTPVHVLPPMSMLCDRFISSLLLDTDPENEKKKSKTSPEVVTPVDLKQSDDVVMDDVTSGSNELEDADVTTKDFDWLVPFFRTKFCDQKRKSKMK